MKVASIFIFFLYLDLNHLFNLIVLSDTFEYFFSYFDFIAVMSLYVVAKYWMVNYYLILSVLTLVAFLLQYMFSDGGMKTQN